MVESPPYFIAQGQEDHEDCECAVVFDVSVEDFEDFENADSVSVLDALHFLLAALSHVEGVAVAGVEVLDAEDGFLLQFAFQCRFLHKDSSDGEPHDGQKQKDQKDIADAHAHSIVSVCAHEDWRTPAHGLCGHGL